MENIREYEAPVRSGRRFEENDDTENSFSMSRIIITQFAVFSLILLMLFIFYRSGGERLEKLREMYSVLRVKDYTVSEIFRNAKSVMSAVPEGNTDAEEPAAAGGEDLILPKDNASFSPFYLSMPIVKPVDSHRITSKFGYRVNPVTGEYGFHSGLDMAADEGSEIFAAFDGVVEKADYSAARGNYIFLNSDGNIKTVYCHCSQLLVSEGETVKAGQVIAKVGSTGQATGPHLHFEIRINGIYYNPEWVLDVR